jgi:hypothetical protein
MKSKKYIVNATHPADQKYAGKVRVTVYHDHAGQLNAFNAEAQNFGYGKAENNEERAIRRLFLEHSSQILSVTRTATLSEMIDGGETLTEEQLTSLVRLLGKGCREKTKARLYSCLSHLSRLDNCGIFGRVNIEGDEADYTAGQSYPDEIKTVRQAIIGA